MVDAVINHSGSALPEGAAEIARHLRRRSLQPVAISAIAMLLDLVGVALGFWFAEFSAAGPTLSTARTVVHSIASAAVTGVLILALGGYRLPALQRFWTGWLLLTGITAAVGILGISGGLWSGAEAALMPALAAMLTRALTSTVARTVVDFGLTERRAVVYGGGEEVGRLIRGLAANPESDIRICGLFDDRSDSRSPPVVIGTPKLGDIGELISFVRTAEVDTLIIALPLSAEKRIRQILDQVRVLPLDVRLSAYSSDFSFPRRSGADALIPAIRRPLDGWRWLAKRGMDVLGAITILTLVSPIMLLTAATIWIESGRPVLFRQQRDGYNNRPVTVWKFRSMHADATDLNGRQVVTKGDPRVTRVGRFIRRWSIDELPQLLNVLQGSLSLVGPRPHVLNPVSSKQIPFVEIVKGYAARHRVPPGLTGWAQIQGWRGEINEPADLKARVACDLYYIENWSLRLDLYILAATPLRLLDHRKAY